MGQIVKSGLSKFFKGCLPQNLLSPLLNAFFICASTMISIKKIFFIFEKNKKDHINFGWKK